jgi:hypothetical protein
MKSGDVLWLSVNSGIRKSIFSKSVQKLVPKVTLDANEVSMRLKAIALNPLD